MKKKSAIPSPLATAQQKNNAEALPAPTTDAAMSAIVRRDTGKSYEQFLTELAKASGIETPTREDLARSR